MYCAQEAMHAPHLWGEEQRTPLCDTGAGVRIALHLASVWSHSPPRLCCLLLTCVKCLDYLSGVWCLVSSNQCLVSSV